MANNPCAFQEQSVKAAQDELRRAQRAEASAGKGAAKRAARKRRREAEQTFKRAQKALKQCQRTARVQIRQDARTDRTKERQKPENVKARQRALGKVAEAAGKAAEAGGEVAEAYLGAQTGVIDTATAPGEDGLPPATVAGSATVGASDWRILAAAGAAVLGLAAILFMKR